MDLTSDAWLASSSEWIKEVMDFFWIFTAATGAPSNRTYVPLSYTSCQLFRMKGKWKAKINGRNIFVYTSRKHQHCTLDTISSAMIPNYETCDALFCGFDICLSRISDSEIPSNAEKDNRTTYTFFVLSTAPYTSTTAQSLPYTASQTKIFIMHDVVQEDDDISNEDDIHLLLRLIATSDVDTNPLQS